MIYFILIVALLQLSCGGDNSTTSAHDNPAIAEGASLNAQSCTFGDGTQITINAAEGSEVLFCIENGGEVENEPTTDSNNPTTTTDSSTTIINPTPTPGAT